MENIVLKFFINIYFNENRVQNYDKNV
jgi:hypothetical protein